MPRCKKEHEKNCRVTFSDYLGSTPADATVAYQLHMPLLKLQLALLYVCFVKGQLKGPP
jgi:hypothetical protein